MSGTTINRCGTKTIRSSMSNAGKGTKSTRSGITSTKRVTRATMIGYYER